MVIDLTTGALPILSSGEWKTIDLKPVLQLTNVRLLQTQTSTGAENKERYRLCLSDGAFNQHGMLATQLNDMVRSQQLQKGSVVQLTEFACASIRNHVIIIILKLNVPIDKCDIIGDPKQFHGNDKNFSNERCMQSSLHQPATTFTRPTTSVPMGGLLNDRDIDHVYLELGPRQGHRQQHQSPPPTHTDHIRVMMNPFPP